MFDPTAFIAWMRSVNIDLKELTAVNKDVAQAVLPVYRAAIPVLSGRLRDSARAGATRKAALIRVGRNLPYAKPVTFGWPAHNIAPHRWDLAAMPAAGEVGRRVHEAGLVALLARHGA